MTEIGVGTILGERYGAGYLLEEEIGHAGRYVIYQATDLEENETVGVVVPIEGYVGRSEYEDAKAARAFVAVKMFGLKSTTRRVHFNWMLLSPDVPGYVGRKRPKKFDSPPRGGNFPLSVKLALLEVAGYRCEDCGSAENLQVDHIEPVYLGGKGTFENGRVLCRDCHQAKTNADRQEYGW